ncbi:MAG: hypothetical protein NC124_15130 [Clostridium sp.]|nr:hypothetical protein [Clostridium sp.]
MNVKVMEGLVGARTNMNLLDTPMRIYKEARQKDDTAAMERAMGYAGEFADKAQEYQAEVERGMEEDAKAAREKVELEGESIPIPKDEYISSEKADSRPSGLYHMERDENGNPKVVYDDPKKLSGTEKNGGPDIETGSPQKEEEAGQSKERPAHRKDDVEKTTANTDAVDREIEKLKKQKQQLEQQINTASGNEEKVKDMEKKLSQMEAELSQKDNDTYRRQNAVIS